MIKKVTISNSITEQCWTTFFGKKYTYIYKMIKNKSVHRKQKRTKRLLRQRRRYSGGRPIKPESESGRRSRLRSRRQSESWKKGRSSQNRAKGSRSPRPLSRRPSRASIASAKRRPTSRSPSKNRKSTGIKREERQLLLSSGKAKPIEESKLRRSERIGAKGKDVLLQGQGSIESVPAKPGQLGEYNVAARRELMGKKSSKK